MVPNGWVLGRSSPFDRYIGPFYYPPGGGVEDCGFVTDERHANTRGVVHGGMIAPAFDYALGNACWIAADKHSTATVHLAVSYLAALPLGQFAILRPEVLRRTRSLVFARGVLSANGTAVASGEGVWKILAQRDDREHA